MYSKTKFLLFCCYFTAKKTVIIGNESRNSWYQRVTVSIK